MTISRLRPSFSAECMMFARYWRLPVAGRGLN